MKTKILKYVGAGVGAVVAGMVLMFGASKVVYPAISQLVGLAVAESAVKWNNVKDAAQGDNLSTGILAMSLYMFDGTNFDRLRGSIANGILVDVTRVTGNVTVIGTATDNTTNSTAKVPTIPCRANAAAPTWTEGFMVPCSVDLAGGMRTSTTGTGSLSQGATLFNSSNVSAADTAIVVTIAAAAGTRAHLYQISRARCTPAGTSTVAVTDGGAQRYSANELTNQDTFSQIWPVPLSGTTNTDMVITMTTCGPGNLGVMALQADRF